MGIPFKTPANDEVSSVVSANAVTNGSHDDLTDPRYAVVNIDVRKVIPVFACIQFIYKHCYTYCLLKTLPLFVLLHFAMHVAT